MLLSKLPFKTKLLTYPSSSCCKPGNAPEIAPGACPVAIWILLEHPHDLNSWLGAWGNGTRKGLSLWPQPRGVSVAMHFISLCFKWGCWHNFSPTFPLPYHCRPLALLHGTISLCFYHHFAVPHIMGTNFYFCWKEGLRWFTLKCFQHFRWQPSSPVWAGPLGCHVLGTSASYHLDSEVLVGASTWALYCGVD